MSPPPDLIFVIRHGEKPDTAPPPHGVDIEGHQRKGSLLPRGWQRAGALTVLFAPRHGHCRAGLEVPDVVHACRYPDHGVHRTHQTVHPLSQRLGLEVQSNFLEGEEAGLVEHVLSSDPGASLICWEHKHIHLIGNAVPTVPGTVIPAAWPDDRFDLVWRFQRQANGYAFSQIPQQLLAGDGDSVIT